MSISGIVAQKLRDTYPTFTAEEIDCIVDSERGKTLRETLEEAVKRHMDGEAQVFGAGFHDRLKAKFQKRSDVFTCTSRLQGEWVRSKTRPPS